MGEKCNIGSESRPDIICFEPGIASRDGGHIYYNVAGTLRANPGDNALTIVCLEGNGIRPSHMGCGFSVGGVMYTLNSTEVHGVAYETDSITTSSE